MHNSALNLNGLTHRVAGAFGPGQSLPAPSLARSSLVPNQLTLSGVVLFVTCALMFGSGFKSLRPEVAGLLVHPFLIPIGVVFPFLVVSRIKLFPAGVLAALAIFLLLISLANFTGGLRGFNEVFKIGISGIGIVRTALLIRSRGDFVAGVLGLALATMAMGIYGLQGTAGTVEGAQGLDVGNKNAYSLFALPSILLSGFVFLEPPVQTKSLRLAVKTVCLLSIGGSALSIFLSANRSGYLGCVIVAAMLLKEKKLYGILLVAMVAAAVVYLMMTLRMTDVFERRLKETFEEKNSSDELRKAIMIACFEVGLEYPLTGVSAKKLPMAIGEKVSSRYANMNVVESHNVFAHIWGSAGILCFSSLALIAWKLWNMPPPRTKQDPAIVSEFKQAQRLMRMLVVLWAIRGMFTAEIVYNPGFGLAIGLATGYCILLSQKYKPAQFPGGMPAMPNPFAVQH